MQLLKVKILVLIVFFASEIQAELSPDGENVCLKAEIFEEKIKVKVQKPKTYIKKVWCWNLKKMFSCKRSYTTWIDVTELRTINRTRIVPKCCDGYKEEREMTNCSPLCPNGCVKGKCVAPEICACISGFYGAKCEKACPDGLWGENCARRCNCSDNGKCDKASGSCDCRQGWMGDRCEFSCPIGYYGYMCKMKCNCSNNSCDHKTGECFTTTALTTTEVLSELLTVTEPIATETTLKVHQANERSKIFTEVSVSDISKTTELDDATEDISDFTEMNTAKEKIIISTLDATISTTAVATKNSISEITKLGNNIQEITSSELTSIKFKANVFTDEIRAIETSGKTEIKLNKIGESEIFFLNGSETFTDKINDNKEKTNNLSETFKPKTNTVPKNSLRNDTPQTNFTLKQSTSEKNIDKNEADNFIKEKKGSSHKKTMIKIFHFLPGLSVFSIVSFLSFIIAAIWLIKKHRNKTKQYLAPAKENDKMFKREEQIKFPKENFFWDNNCTNNPVYLSDIHVNCTIPTLKTFKPLTNDKNVILTSKEIR